MRTKRQALGKNGSLRTRRQYSGEKNWYQELEDSLRVKKKLLPRTRRQPKGLKMVELRTRRQRGMEKTWYQQHCQRKVVEKELEDRLPEKSGPPRTALR